MSDGDPVLQFYDAEGNQVREGSPRAVVQYLSDDPSRPDAKSTKEPAEDKAVRSAPADKSTKAPADLKASRT
jgi:hypothetical protein